MSKISRNVIFSKSKIPTSKITQDLGGEINSNQLKSIKVNENQLKINLNQCIQCLKVGGKSMSNSGARSLGPIGLNWARWVRTIWQGPMGPAHGPCPHTGQGWVMG